MTNEQAVFEVLAYRRNVGTTLNAVWRNVAYRTKNKQAKKRALAILRKLESDGELTSVGEWWFLTPAGAKRAKGSQLAAVWLQADAWVLLAAIYACGQDAKDLDALIATADWINHAIPTHVELHGAINRLLAGRLLKTKRDKLMVTERATDLFEKVEASGRRAVLRQLDRLRRMIDCPCCGVPLKVVRWRYTLDAQTYREAVASYRSRC
ncbi:MAG: hypothetical protein DRI90_19790 [Deltaproteobacteria bacterium]|nr:MAG: hypothetical protein DRI90_19790 [Deltaproteobacteria bacterium]